MCGGAILVFIVTTLWFNHPAPSTNGLHPIAETAAQFHLFRHQGDGDGIVTISAPASDLGHTARYVLDDGRLYLADGEPSSDGASVTASVTRSYYLADITKLDLGAWSAYNAQGHGSDAGRALEPAPHHERGLRLLA